MKHLKQTFFTISLPPLLVALLLLFSATTAVGFTDDLTDDFQFSDYPTTRFCPIDTAGGPTNGDTAAVFADVDGIDNGYNDGYSDGPWETMVVISTVRGEMYAETLSGANRVMFFSFFETNCGEPNCSVSNTCDKGRLVMQFVDMLAPGFVWYLPSTWVKKRVSYVSFQISHDYCYDYDDPKFNSVPAYQQARAYRTIPLTDIVGSCYGGTCEFSDATGIQEVFITTDFCENILDELILGDNYLPSNTPVGSNVVVPVGNSTITFSQVTGAGGTTVREAAPGTELPANFSLCDPPVYYIIESSATYSGTIEICINYPDSCDESNLKLLHNDVDPSTCAIDPGCPLPGECIFAPELCCPLICDMGWVDATSSVDTANNIICAEVSSLSEFAATTSICLKGDCNGDGSITSADVTCTIIEIFEPAGNLCADCNGDGSVTSADVTCTIIEIFNP